MIRYGVRGGAELVEHLAEKNNSPHLKKIKEYGPACVDAATGGLVISALAVHTSESYTRIKQSCVEAVAMDTGKDPKKIGFWDLYRSDNTVVREAMHNYIKFNTTRALAGLTFFVRPIAKVINFFVDPGGAELERQKQYKQRPTPLLAVLDTLANTNSMEFGMAITGLLFTLEQRRSKTTHESMASYLIEKFNSGSNILFNGDVNDLYKTFSKHLKTQHKGPIPADKRDNLKVMFQRIEELMHITYNRHEGKFNHPAFVHLLGHGKLDFDNIDESMLYIETMFKHGSSGVKKVDELLKKKESISVIAEKLGVEVDVPALRKKYYEKDSMLYNTDVKPRTAATTTPEKAPAQHAQQQGQRLHQHAVTAQNPSLAMG